MVSLNVEPVLQAAPKSHPVPAPQALITPWNYPLLMSSWKASRPLGRTKWFLGGAGALVGMATPSHAPGLPAVSSASRPTLVIVLSLALPVAEAACRPLAEWPPLPPQAPPLCPLLLSFLQVAPALAAGNTCVLKPSELASLTSLELAAIAQEVRGRVVLSQGGACRSHA